MNNRRLKRGGFLEATQSREVHVKKQIRKGTKICYYSHCHGVTKAYSAVVEEVRRVELGRREYHINIDDGQGVVWGSRKVIAIPCHVRLLDSV